jgi:subtilase family serine protease
MRVFRAVLFVCLLSTLTFAAVPNRVTRAIDASQTVELARSVHPKAQARYDQGVVSPDFELGYVTLTMSPSASQQRAIDQLLAEQQDPASPNYHHWLTPEQYADRFGLSQDDINRITAWLKAQGFTVLSVPRGRNSIIVSGTASQFESAFQTEIHHYRVNGRLHYANATPLKVPAALSGIVTGVRGLSDFRMKPYGIRRSMRPNYYDSTVGQLVAPDDVATIYNIKALYANGYDGTGQKLAVVGQTDVYLADLNYFRSGFGFSQINGCTTNASGVVTACNSTNFRYVLVGTETGTASKCGDLSEADLDIEWAGATARNAQIIYVNSPLVWDSQCQNPTNSNGGVEDALAYAIQNNTAPVISMSYGICEAQAYDHEAELQQANLQGITVVNSSGDVGAAGCDYSPPNSALPYSPAVLGQAVSYPASSPEVTGVGGTHIPLSEMNDPQYFSTTNGTNLGTALKYVPEVGWNDDTEFATYCQTHASNLFCKQGGDTKVTGWVALGAAATAAQVQQDIWINSGGGGPSNCYGEVFPGGICTNGFARPAWQSGLSVAGVAAQLTGYRYTPDVSLMASPNFPGYILCTPLSELSNTSSTTSSCASGIPNAVDTNFSIVGGTSASAPVFAGIVAILNQYLVGSSSPGLGNINPKLYSLAATPANGAFHQVTSGNNLAYCQSGEPSNQTTLTSIQCPGTGVLGYDAANFDATTHYNLVTGLGSVDANALALAWSASRTASSTGLAATPTTVFLGNSTNLTATVTPVTATGTVSFVDNGSTTLATVSLDGTTGVAVFHWTPTSSQLGSNSITASYGGDGINGTSTSSPVVVTVKAPTFTLATSPSSHTVQAGQTSLNYSITATPTSSSTFEGSVSLSCSFSPTDPTLTASSCTFSPSSTIAAGSGATTVTMTIATKGPNSGTGAAIQHRADSRSPWLPLALPIAGVMLAGFAGRKGAKSLALAGLCISLMLFGVLIACGGGSNPVAITVSPTSASLYPNYTGWPAQTASFTASLTNTTNTAVNWTATSGTIDASGNYTAPTIASGLPSSVTIKATSQADSTKSATATVTLKSATMPTTYNVTVMATEATTSNSKTVSLVVQ